jgi:hypothetical protein
MYKGVALSTAILLALMLIPAGTEARTVLVNSQDWIDVYSGLLYAKLTNNPALFMTSTKYVTVLQKMLPAGDSILVIESQRLPYFANVGGTLRRQGYDQTTIFSGGGSALNLELAKQLNLNRFVIVDPTYGFNAVSVGPYAISTKAFVLFADDRNIDQVFTYLSSVPKIEKLIIYGSVSEAVMQKLAGFSPEVINTGNRYKDNIELLNRYFQANPTAQQAVLTSGEFLENEIVGGEPVILVGRERVLPNTVSFVKNSNLKTTVLIGNELTGSAKMLKEQTGIPVFVKVGQGVPMGVATYEPIKALDMFYLPMLVIQIELGYVQYNTLDKNIEIVYRNRGVRTFFSGTINILVDGQTIQTIGDKEVQRLERNETLGFRYPVDLSEYVGQNRNITAGILTIYGESTEIMDRAIMANVPIRFSTANDQCELKLGRVTFDTNTQRISVVLDNPSQADCYASINLLDMTINDQKQLVNYPGQAFIPAGTSQTFKIKQRMTTVDIADNPTVHVKVLYGAQDGLLFKFLDETVPFTLAGEYTTIIIVAVIAVLLIVIIVLFVLWRRSRKEKVSSHKPEYHNWR